MSTGRPLTIVTTERPDWHVDAVCAQTDPDAFYPEKGDSTRAAKQVCAGCPVIAECRAYAFAHEERFGIWGGLSEMERKRIRRAQRVNRTTATGVAGNAA